MSKVDLVDRIQKEIQELQVIANLNVYTAVYKIKR